ncbi:MAG: EMC3/TMCO1 family protein [Candidatus Woesearchaeota archaeon]
MSSFLDTIFNPWLGLALELPPFWAILIVSAFITVIVTVAYKYTTNQSEMKRIKDDLKKYQKEMRGMKDTTKLMATQKKALELNMQYMKSSFKSTLYTFIPIIIIFAWLNMHIAYEPILPNTEFTITAAFGTGAMGNISLETTPELEMINGATQEILDGKAVWRLKGTAGEYKTSFKYNNEAPYSHAVLITEENTYLPPQKIIKDSKLKTITNGNSPVRPFGENFNIFGWHPGWLATYILLSILLSAGFRKIMKVY